MALRSLRADSPRAESGLIALRERTHTPAKEHPFGISHDGQPLETTLKLAAEVASRLAELDKLAKHVASRDLRGGYNDGCNEYDEAQDDGTFKTVLNPKLSEACS